jgi:hypothetical protein
MAVLNGIVSVLPAPGVTADTGRSWPIGINTLRSRTSASQATKISTAFCLSVSRRQMRPTDWPKVKLRKRRAVLAVVIFIGEIIGLERITRTALKATPPAAIAITLQTGFTRELPALGIEIAATAAPPDAIGESHDINLHREFQPSLTKYSP